MVQVKVFSTPVCPWCFRAKEYLKAKKIKFQEYNVMEDEKARDEMVKKSGQMGVPVIMINDAVIVGFDQSAIDKALKEEA